MAAWSKIIHVNQEEIPQEMFGKKYGFFSFDILKDKSPIFLAVAESGHLGECVALVGLDILDNTGKQRLVDFLKSITLVENYLPIKFDVELVKREYGVDMQIE